MRYNSPVSCRHLLRCWRFLFYSELCGEYISEDTAPSVFSAFRGLCPYLFISNLNPLSRLVCALLRVHPCSDFLKQLLPIQVLLLRELLSFRQAPQILISAPFFFNTSHFSSCSWSGPVFSLFPFALSLFACTVIVPAQISQFSCAVSHSIFFPPFSTSIYFQSYHTPFPSSHSQYFSSLYLNQFCFLFGLDAIKVGSLGRHT